ncbi:isoquinoline 1-oxidoreductase beta subunit [Rubricella aquisinus]|uniref:Isoquinoline 1-oxidoreductase beta subunit n=1 Tax=Rubricella aquisinus TaxID=2028108 RepID=A0A840X377_9RHOB|nr:molybdopterin cofactor-binding domain-containing protein [Rubricella aquisinus]MBB5515127.1 isoquinoline 1-oxidoreductase beta subunit [Rubricella aquisinus]
MGRARTIARRSFLIGSAAIVGGVAFGVFVAKRPIPNPLLETLGEGEAAITPYVKIDASGITLITPRADMGQGSYSVQAYLIAEELDIDPTTATLTPGQPGPAYFNRAVLGEVVPFAAHNRSAMAEGLRNAMAVPAKFLAFQMTGGSSTVPDSYTRLRMAGATARETLKDAAARQTGHARATLRTEDGHVILPDGTRIAYTALARHAAEIAPVTDVTLRDPSEWRYLGREGLMRTDMRAKVTGEERFGIDITFPGMKFATVRANPGLGGEVIRYDASAAETMRGVERIIPISHGIAVVADNTWRAFRAADALEITWGAPDYPATSEAMFDTLEQTLSARRGREPRLRNDGDAAQVLENAPRVIEARYRVPYLAHAPLEPMNAVVHASPARLDIWTGTQIPLFIRDRAARIAGIDKGDVHVHVYPMGGSFGHRLEMTHVEQAVEIARALPDTPIKMTWSREEDMTHDYPRPAAVAHARGTVTEGRVECLDLSVAQSGMLSSWFGRLMGLPVPGYDPTLTAGAWDQPFAIPHYRVTGYRAQEMVPISSWRAVGATSNGFFHDCFLDELIHAAGADPLAERIRLCSDPTSRRVLETVGELAGWTGPDLGPQRGRGVGFTQSFGVPCAHVVEVTQTDRGIRIDKVFTAIDSGRVLDPTNYRAQGMGGVIWGLGHAMNCALTYENHAPQQTNFDSYAGMRMYQVPQIEIRILEDGQRIRGVGEPPVPPAAPALANAIFAATGQRIRTLPLRNEIAFL